MLHLTELKQYIYASVTHRIFIPVIISVIPCFCLPYSIRSSQSDVLSSPGYPSLQAELETPTGLHYPPPTPFQQDDYFSDSSSLESPFRTPSRLSDGLAPPRGHAELSAAGPPVVAAEDTSLEDSRLEDAGPVAEAPEAAGRGGSQVASVCPSEYPQHPGRVPRAPKDAPPAEPLKQAREMRVSSEQQEEPTPGPDEEVTEEQLRCLFEDIQLEEGVSEEMTEEKVQAILKRVRQAELAMSSIAGWQSEAGGGPDGPARRVPGALLDRLDDRYAAAGRPIGSHVNSSFQTGAFPHGHPTVGIVHAPKVG